MADESVRKLPRPVTFVRTCKMVSQLNDKVAIVTGSSSGIGEAIVISFASRGARVTLCGRDQERLNLAFNKAVDASGGFQDRFISVQGDLNDSDVRKAVVTKTVEKFGRLDILVVNAGVVDLNSTISNTTEESYDTVMDTNLKSAFFIIQTAVPELVKTQGNIINISSAGTFMASPNILVYVISKAGLDHLTRCLAVDLGSKGIRVNSVNPGFIPTRILRDVGENYEQVSNEFSKIHANQSALKGKTGTVEDVAELVAFLASDAAGFITGENIRVDGGRIFYGVSDEHLQKKEQVQ